MAQARKRHHNWLLYIFITLLLSHESACQSHREGVLGISIRVRSLASTYKGIHGWPYSYNKISGKWLLNGLERNMEWVKMQFQHAKLRSFVIKRGKVIDKHRFLVAGTNIPTLTEKLIKSFGKTLNSSLKDTIPTCQMIDDLNEVLAKLDKSGLPGCFKAWIYQHSLLPRLLWLLLIYKFLISTVGFLERSILRAWEGD